MPVYVYEIVLEGDEADEGGMQFEVVQGIHDDPLTEHPVTGQPVRRVITSVSAAGKWTDLKAKGQLADGNLKDKGFGKYEKTEDGYRKVSGHGPDSLSAADVVKKQMGL